MGQTKLHDKDSDDQRKLMEGMFAEIAALNAALGKLKHDKDTEQARHEDHIHEMEKANAETLIAQRRNQFDRLHLVQM